MLIEQRLAVEHARARGRAILPRRVLTQAMDEAFADARSSRRAKIDIEPDAGNNEVLVTATWQPNPQNTSWWQRGELVDDDGRQIALLEDFGDACYPSALNAKTGNWERSGAYSNRVEAILWAERVAGLRRSKDGDFR
jgi:hypothetical protein